MTKLLGPASVGLVDVQYLDWSAATAEKSVCEFIQTGPRIDALWTANDPMALGAMTALREPGYVPGKDFLPSALLCQPLRGYAACSIAKVIPYSLQTRVEMDC